MGKQKILQIGRFTFLFFFYFIFLIITGEQQMREKKLQKNDVPSILKMSSKNYIFKNHFELNNAI